MKMLTNKKLFIILFVATLICVFAPSEVFAAAKPNITSANNSTGAVGQPFGFQIIATRAPFSYNATGLPAGLTVDNTTGLIVGVPTEGGSFSVTISATNSAGTATQNHTMTINTPTPTQPVISSAAYSNGAVSVAFSFQCVATNNPTGWSASGLPNGLSINATTGLISGTPNPSSGGIYNILISATNAGGTGTQSHIIFLNAGKPTITSATTSSGTKNQAFSFQVVATNSPDYYDASNLPTGLSINNSSGLISGTPTLNGSFSVTLTASNSIGVGSQSHTMTISDPVPGVPVITSAATSSGAINTSFTFQITATDSPTSYSQTGLPTGLSLNTSTGAITGTPTVSGTYSVTLRAINATGTGSQGHIMTINPGPPTITNASISSCSQDQFHYFQITASNSPTSFNATGLPDGITVNISTGEISGTPTVSGIFAVTISATNAGGTGNQSHTLTVNPPPPVITNANSSEGTQGSAFSFQINATNTPTSYSVTGTLPTGITLNTSTGLLSGTPTNSGTFNITLNATNQSGTGSQAHTMTIIVPGAAPVVNSATTSTGTEDSAFSFTITATNTPDSYDAVGLPDGLSVNTTTGAITGTPTTNGVFNVTMSATNATGTGTQNHTMTIRPPAPVITSLTTSSGVKGSMYTYNIVATNNPTSYSATNLPSGLTINTTTGVISGVPTVSGTFNTIVLTATNVTGNGTQNHTMTITDPGANIPVVTSSSTSGGTMGSAYTFQITGTYSPTSYNAVTLPAGLSVNTGTGAITGTPTVWGSFNVTISATNAYGTGTQAHTISINPIAPVITNASTSSGTQGVAFSFNITATNSPSSYSATGLPAGISLNTSTGAITGTPTTSGTFNVTLNATNPAGTGSQTHTMTIAPPAPSITSSATSSGSRDQAFSLQITATNNPTSYSVTGTLPTGVTLNTTTGLISGTPTNSGTFNITLSATNATGTGNQSHTMTINIPPPDAPVITSAITSTGDKNVAFSFNITATNTPTSYSASGLPTGLSLNTSTGAISGTPTVSGSFIVSMGATNVSGTGTQSHTMTIRPPAPVITSSATSTGTKNLAFSFQIVGTNTPTSYNAVGLPAGLSVNTGTGLINGTPTASGTFNVTISATNLGGTGSQSHTMTIVPPAPAITSANSSSGTQNSVFSFQIVATNSPTSYNATGLPTGLAVNTTTGIISGTPTVIGVSTVTISATNSGGTGTQTHTMTIVAAGSAPVINSATTSTGQKGVAFSFTITATNTPTSYNAVGLPAGLSVNTSTGAITGTPTVSGTFNVTMQATNAYGTGTQNHTMTILPATPVITSAATSTGDQSVAFSFSVTATNTPTSYAATNLPTGLSINASTGVISGTPTVNGTFNTIVISATNAGGTGQQNHTMTIRPPAPVITSSASSSGQQGVAFSFTITATNTPTSYNATGLPTGLSVNTTTGVISGTPTASGTFTVTISATNAGGTGTQSHAMSILPQPPVVTSAATSSGQVGVAFTFNITATNSPNAYNATNLPAGLSVNTTTGVISGTPTASGTFNTIVISATNNGGTGTQNHTITILPATPVITSATTSSGDQNQAFSFMITATNSPTSYNATGLPAGVSVNTSSGLISGTPTTNGVFTVDISATNAGGTGTQTHTMTIRPPIPTITSATTSSGNQNQAFSFQITATFSPTSYNATNLPTGVTVNTSTGLISGTPTQSGTFNVTISATNATGTGNQAHTMTIIPLTPVITSSASSLGDQNQAFSFQITATNSPTSYNATNLPSGLSVNTSTGLISGVPGQNGIFTVTISATNAGGTGTQDHTMTIRPPAPVITSATTSSGTQDAAFSFQITASNSPSSYNATGLPAGVSVNTSTGLISGTPTEFGTFNVTVSATNAGGTGNQAHTMTIASATPTITSAATSTGSEAVAFTFQITATNNPTSYDATGLPAGLSVNNGTGEISGTPTTNGSFNVTISATNAAGTGTQAHMMTINPSAPTITSSLTSTIDRGYPYTYQITATCNPTSYSATGLPAALSLNTTTGLISGQVTDAGTPFSIDITATNATGSDTKTLVLTVTTPAAPSITSATSDTGYVGIAYSYQIVATNNPYEYSAVDLPAGLSVNTTTGLISGTPTAGGVASVTLTATNYGGTGNQTLTLTIIAAPTITSGNAASGTQGTNYPIGSPLYTITATSNPTSYDAVRIVNDTPQALPAWLSFDAPSGKLYGTPTANGTFIVEVSATNAAGTGTKRIILSISGGATYTNLYIPVMYFDVTWSDAAVLSNYGPVAADVELTFREAETGAYISGPFTYNVPAGRQVLVNANFPPTYFSVQAYTTTNVVVQGVMFTDTTAYGTGKQCIVVPSYPTGYTNQWASYIEYRNVADSYINVFNPSGVTVSYNERFYADNGAMLTNNVVNVPPGATYMIYPDDPTARSLGIENASGNLICNIFVNQVYNNSWSVHPLQYEDGSAPKTVYIPVLVNQTDTWLAKTSLTNRGVASVPVTYTYRDFTGTSLGSGTVNVAAGQRVLVPDTPQGTFNLELSFTGKIVATPFYIGQTGSGVNYKDFIFSQAFQAVNTLPATFVPEDKQYDIVDDVVYAGAPPYNYISHTTTLVDFTFTKSIIVMNTESSAQDVTWKEYDSSGAITSQVVNVPAKGCVTLTPTSTGRMYLVTGTNLVGVEVVTTPLADKSRVNIIPMMQTKTD